MSTRREVLRKAIDDAQAEIALLDSIEAARELLRQLQLHHNSMGKGSSVSPEYNRELAAKCWEAGNNLSRWSR